MLAKIARRFIKLFTFEGDLVLNPFTGSGTTLKIAKESNRNYIGYGIRKALKSNKFKIAIEYNS
jgi:DNA modification methylase